jgi:hypothetical protein
MRKYTQEARGWQGVCGQAGTTRTRFPVALEQIWRVLKVGGAETTKIYSNHTMTGKQLSRLGIAGDRRVAHVHHRVLDVSVPQPILYECNIRTDVQEMHGNRVTQRMKPPLGFRNRRDLAILLHQVPI